jgi:two-component system NtrC family sensor kinase
LRYSFYSLRTGVLTHLVFLVVSAMLLINVVMIKFAERDLIDSKLHAGRMLFHALEHRVGYETITKGNRWPDLESDPSFRGQITQLVQFAGFMEALIINKEGERVFSTKSFGDMEKRALSNSRESLVTGNLSHNFYGSTWGVIWLAHESLTMSAPIHFEGYLLGAITISSHLSPLYHTLRKSEKIVLIYILLNTVAFVLLGLILLSRTVINPIHKLLRITEEFQEDKPFPQLVESSRNEIGQLFRSLNMMLSRLEENKKELRTHISSLEKANQEIKKAQDEIIKSEKLASVGRLATGVAHEIGNPIGIILGYLELLNREDLDKEERKDLVDRIESETTRVSHIIRQLLDFSRTSGEPQHSSVHGLVMETIDMLKPQPLTAHMKIEAVLKATADSVWADPNQLKQVFLNIMINAADAMLSDAGPDEGASAKTLAIETNNIRESVEIRFTDAGPGIQQAELLHIFDPFYTTKEPGKGTGLGLSICYRIVESLGGTIRAESVVGKGTTIIIDIPLYHTRNVR